MIGCQAGFHIFACWRWRPQLKCQRHGHAKKAWPTLLVVCMQLRPLTLTLCRLRHSGARAYVHTTYTVVLCTTEVLRKARLGIRLYSAHWLCPSSMEIYPVLRSTPLQYKPRVGVQCDIPCPGAFHDSDRAPDSTRQCLRELKLSLRISSPLSMPLPPLFTLSSRPRRD